MITDDGTLSYHVDPPAKRLFAHRLRHLVNPVLGIACGLVFGAALFLIAVQALFGVRPSIVAILLALAAVVVYVAAVLRARQAAGALGAYKIVLADSGISVASTHGSGGYAWGRFTRWLENDDDFVLASGGVRRRLIVVLPKDGVPEDEQDLIREVLHANIDPDDEPIEDAFVEMDWDAEPARRAAD